MTDVLTKPKLTREDYRKLPEGPPYYELINGELTEMTRPQRRHYRISNLLIEWWNPWARQARGELALEPNLYLPGTEDVYHPGLVYVAAEHRSICQEDGIWGTPEVICEILSPSTEKKDRGVKLKAYRSAGVPHVWLIDPIQPVMVEEYTLNSDHYYLLNATVTAPAEWEPAAFPGWRVSLAELDAAVSPIEG
jgi:Uma2 family endonuclease